MPIDVATATMNDIVRESVRIEMELNKLRRLWDKEFQLANKDIIDELKMLRSLMALKRDA